MAGSPWRIHGYRPGGCVSGSRVTLAYRAFNPVNQYRTEIVVALHDGQRTQNDFDREFTSRSYGRTVS